MRHQRFYTLVGLFVTGALGLLIVGGVFFYQEYTQAKVETYVMFFKGSLRGLGVGTPVTYRGIKIGEVKLIEITENKAGDNVNIPVYVEFFVEKSFGMTRNPIKLLIQNGYKADISVPNFLTSVADIELIQKLEPNQNKQTYFRGHPVFPTIESIKKFTSLDDSLKAANNMFEDISRFIKSKKLAATLESAKAMTDEVRELGENLNQKVPTLTNTLGSLDQSLAKVSSAADATKNFMDYLSRYPESLLRGKQ